MTLRSGTYVRKDAVKGTTPLEARLALAGMFDAWGVLKGMAVTGRTSWAYNVAAGNIVSQRTAADGVVLFANDSPAVVGTNGEGTTIPPAPASGSRIDIIYALHRDVDNGDPNSQPTFGVASGVADGTPQPPTIPEGAVELARATLAAGATNTAHANVTLSREFVKQARLRLPPGVPWATARGSRVVTYGATAPGATVTIGFPAGRFEVPPMLQVTKATSVAAKAIPYVNNVTTTGATIGLYTGDGTNITAGTEVLVHWEAVQMTETTAGG